MIVELISALLVGVAIAFIAWLFVGGDALLLTRIGIASTGALVGLILNTVLLRMGVMQIEFGCAVLALAVAEAGVSLRDSWRAMDGD